MPGLSISCPAFAQENMDSAGDPVPLGCNLTQLDEGVLASGNQGLAGICKGRELRTTYILM